MRLEGIRGVTFDAGGTLIAPNPGVGAIYAEVAAAHGIRAEAGVLDLRFRAAFKHLRATSDRPVSEETERTFWRGLARGAFLDYASDQEFDAMFPELWNTFAEARRWRAPEGTLDTLKELKRRGFQLAVLSNFDSRLHSILEGLGIAELMEATFISAEIGVAKPRLGIFEHASRMLGLQANQLIHVGDNADADAAGAVAAGWSAALIRHEYPGAVTIGGLAELTSMLG